MAFKPQVYMRLALGIAAFVVAAACSLSFNLPVGRGDPDPATSTPFVPNTSTPIVPTATPIPPTSTSVVVVPTTVGCSVRSDWFNYVVAAGDTLSRIAQRTGTTSAVLAQANCLANANAIYAGQVIKVPMLLPPTTPPTLQPVTPTYYSQGIQPYDACIVNTRAGTVAPLFAQPNAAAALPGYLGNWGIRLGEQNGFHQISITPQGIVAWVRLSDTYVSGFCIYPPTETPLPYKPNITQGSVVVSSFVDGQAGNYRLRTGESVVLTWDAAPAGVMSATFYTIAQDGTRIDLGTDYTPDDGLAILWIVPANLNAHQLLVEGPGLGAANFSFATSYPIRVYSPPPPSETCYIEPLQNVNVYDDPDYSSAITDLLTPGNHYPVIARTSDGWIGIEISLGWVAPNAPVSFSGPCP